MSTERERRNVVAVVGPSDTKSCAAIIECEEEGILVLAEEAGRYVAAQGLGMVAVPYKGVGKYASKGYTQSGGRELCRVLPRGVDSEIAAHETVSVESWREQPEALVSRADVMVVVGISAGTLIEMCITKRYGKYPIWVFQRTFSCIPREVEQDLNIKYLESLLELEKMLRGYRECI
jgi:predicted Rossmann-fold nucleotide-binding protein